MEWKQLKNVEKIGEGSFGNIYKCQYDKKIVAVKVYKSKSVRHEQNIKSSLDLASKIKHPYLITCYNYFYDKVDNEVCLISILEYFDGVHINVVPNLDKKLKIYLPQIVAALKYLHFNKIIHRDIKAENILINFKDEKAKIIDYDFLKRTETNTFDCKNGTSGTLLYTSPEIFARKSYNYSADLWSLGVTLYYSLSGIMPFNAEDRQGLTDLILSDYVPDFSILPFKYIQIISGLLHKDHSKRLTLSEVLSLLS